ncbi:DNase I [Chlorella sorokiniana]|uniref:DNase I n=1 Tax=Chlorella sorokiniana TaxID=3076 RepID=A0A2P6TD03_CHLSO|nr:DNase I [Chlorella sorokiniana]|eukprot:PRW20519.1 DNase I [Chlorella sorokiniana]
MWPGEPEAGKAAGGHSAPRVLLAALVLAATFAGLGMLLLQGGQLAGGLQHTAFRSALSSLPPLSSAGHHPQQPQSPLQLPLNLTASSAVHGRLVKAGPQPSLEAIAKGGSWCERSYADGCPWLRERLEGSAPPFPSKWCAAMYNDKYQLIYLKCPKTAGNTLVAHFGNCDGDAVDTCLKYLNIGNTSEVQHVVSKWQDYFVFGFSRNILARAISQYRYLAHFVNADWPLAAWDEFCTDPFVLGDMVQQADAAGQQCCSQSAEHQYVHVLPQAHCFTTATNEPAVDWLGRVEHFAGDVAELFQLLNSRPGVPKLPVPAAVDSINMAEPAHCTQRRSQRSLLGGGSGGGGGGRALAYHLRNGTFNPCDQLDYFRDRHAHCLKGLARFLAEDTGITTATPSEGIHGPAFVRPLAGTFQDSWAEDRFGDARAPGPQAALVAIAGSSSACDLSYWHGCPWTEQRLAGNAPPFPSKWCATLYNDKYRLIFLKCPKTAGTALLPQFKVCGFGNTTDRCLKFVDVNNATEVQHVVSKWQDYFVFGFSRNILARTVSQYRYLAHFVNADWPLSSWDEFCADPFVLGDMALQAHAAGKDCCSQSAEHQYVHVLPQAHCFTTANKQPALDWLGRVEHYEKDIRELFQLLNCRPGVPRLPLLLPLSHLNSAPQTQCTQRHRSRRLLGSGRGGGGTAGPTFQPRNDTFNPCNELDYFRGPHTHCYTDLMRFHAEDLKLDLVDAWNSLLKFSFEVPLAAQRIEPAQLAVALAALRRPRVPLPLDDPAEQHTFTVLCYNISFENTCAQQRIAAIGCLIEQAPMRLPDFILLQEMTHAFYLQFAGMPWWQAYDATPAPLPPPFGEHYFTTILWRRDSLAAVQCHPPRRFKQTCMGRDLKAMDEMLPLLDYSPEPNCIVAGDMNWIHVNNVYEPVLLPPGWVDVWSHLRPEDPGWTYDSVVCYQKGRKYGRGLRMDRMFCRLADWEPLAIEMVGREPIAGLMRTVRLGKTERSDKTIPVWPSDHFGLFAVFVRKQPPGSS